MFAGYSSGRTILTILLTGLVASLIGCTVRPTTTTPAPQATAREPAPPVQFLYRRDRQRLSEQKERAKLLASDPQALQAATSATAGEAPRPLSRDFATLFDLPGSGLSTANTTGPTTGRDGSRPMPFSSTADMPMVGVGLDESAVASLLQYDLTGVRVRLGEQAVYTLQVARYGRIRNEQPTPEELASARSAAEQAVLALRKAGDEAYFFHGPFGSSVTVGVFGEADYVAQVRGPDGAMTTLQRPYESPLLTALRVKFPHNLVNGKTYEVRNKGADEATTQSSFLVRIP